MTDVKWIRIDTDLFENRKIKYIRTLPNGTETVLIFLQLLTLAGQCNDGGKVYLTPDIPYTAETLAIQTGFSPTVTAAALTALENCHMIHFENAILIVTGWEETQNTAGLERIREQTRQRVQQCRQRKKQECNATVTQCNATEEEGEEEREEEIETSFNHSGKKDFSKNAFSTGFSTDFSTDLSTDLSDIESAKRKYLGGKLGCNVVFLSDDQIGDLLSKLSLEEFDHYVQVVAQQELAGKHYRKKTHYQAILEMAQKDRGI